MLQQIIYTLPEISLLIGIINLLILRILGYEKSRTYGAVARLWLLVSAFCAIIFYNQSINNLYFENNAYTLLFILGADIAIYIMFLVSTTWFAAVKRTGCRYYILILAIALCINLLITSINIQALFLGYGLLIGMNYLLLKIDYDKNSAETAKRYLIISYGLILLLAIISGVYIAFYTGETTYKAIATILLEKNKSLPLFLSSIGIFLPCFYALNIAPFHIMAEEKVSKSILPVQHYFAIVVPIIFFGVLIKLNQTIGIAYKNELSLIYMIMAFISMLFGAIGANARINLHRIYAYSTLYHFSVVLMLLSIFNHSTTFTALIYLIAYLIALNNLYIVFYNLRSHGEYLSSVSSLAGLAQTRPYTTGALLVGLFSMMGLPPLVGFLGQIDMVYQLLNAEKYIALGCILLGMLLLAKSYLSIIKTIYFEQKMKTFDTENKFMLIYTIINTILILILAFNPFQIIEALKDMFYVIFL